MWSVGGDSFMVSGWHRASKADGDFASLIIALLLLAFPIGFFVGIMLALFHF